ncbi:MAG: 3'-5' exonuclease [Gammaproteobacteria bacterium]|nr:3'-5' exonuclease [Gammaproteobacteria bacterium]
MATLIPTLNSCVGRMQAGEKRFAWRLGSHLEDDYLCWYEIPVGKRQRYSDFIILHPARGLLLLEVKDWKLDTIHRIDSATATITTSSGLKTVSNPLQQVRQCAYLLVQRLERDPQLVVQAGRYQGRLAFPYGYGVVLSNITRRQFESSDLGEVLPEHQTLCRDEMTESVDPEAFQTRLWNMFSVQFPTPLTLPQIDRIRWHLFPEVRIDGDAQGNLFPSEPGTESVEALVPDIVKVMDMQQELLSRSLGEGHRVIHGVSGSGKTLILAYRCLYLAKLMHKPILVLCFNITLAARLRDLMDERGVANRVNVYHFHDWCGAQLRTYHVARPAPRGDYVEELVQRVIAAVERGAIPSGQYGAVLIDEGHDFEPDWLKLATGMVDPETNSLLLLYDDAQSIYSKRSRLDFSLSSVGIHARGRTTVLKLNYRNTEEILRFAYHFACRYLNPGDADDDHVPLVTPESAGRHGPAPVVRVFESFEAEARYIASLFRRIRDEQDLPWSSMCITYRKTWMGKVLSEALAKAGVPVQWLGSSQDRKRFRPRQEDVKLMTMHSSKGLEFPLVAVAGVGYMSDEGEDAAVEAKLLYVAMTRAMDKLLVTSHRETEFLRQLVNAEEPGAAPKAEVTNPT